jgi:hypothetical protein
MENFMTSYELINFSRKPLLHGVSKYYYIGCIIPESVVSPCQTFIIPCPTHNIPGMIIVEEKQ